MRTPSPPFLRRGGAKRRGGWPSASPPRRLAPAPLLIRGGEKNVEYLPSLSPPFLRRGGAKRRGGWPSASPPRRLSPAPLLIRGGEKIATYLPSLSPPFLRRGGAKRRGGLPVLVQEQRERARERRRLLEVGQVRGRGDDHQLRPGE